MADRPSGVPGISRSLSEPAPQHAIPRGPWYAWRSSLSTPVSISTRDTCFRSDAGPLMPCITCRCFYSCRESVYPGWLLHACLKLHACDIWGYNISVSVSGDATHKKGLREDRQTPVMTGWLRGCRWGGQPENGEPGAVPGQEAAAPVQWRQDHPLREAQGQCRPQVSGTRSPWLCTMTCQESLYLLGVRSQLWQAAACVVSRSAASHAQLWRA